MGNIASFRKASLVALTFIFLGWTFDSTIMSQIMHEGTFFEQFFQPDAHHLWMRIPPAVLTIALVFFIRYFMIRQKKTIVKLEKALSEVDTLSGLLPICAWCKKIRDDKGYWKEVESYLGEHAGTEFTHGMCPECHERQLKEHNLR